MLLHEATVDHKNQIRLKDMIYAIYQLESELHRIGRYLDFYPRDAMLARVIEIARVCASVRHAPVLCQNEEC